MVVAAKKLEAIHYPESDHVGEHELQRFIAELLRPLIERWLRDAGRVAHAGADQYFYFIENDPSKTRAPDVYVIDGVAQDVPEVGVWKTWEGHRPDFALEIVGGDWKKDYFDAPADYDAMGARELVIFDPWATARSRKRVRWQVFRRTRAKGLVQVGTSMDDRVYAKTLGFWLRLVDHQGHPRLRLGDGVRGATLFPTLDEINFVLRSQADAERAAKDTERAAREAAEREIVRLRAELDALRRQR